MPPHSQFAAAAPEEAADGARGRGASRALQVGGVGITMGLESRRDWWVWFRGRWRSVEGRGGVRSGSGGGGEREEGFVGGQLTEPEPSFDRMP